MTVLKSGLILPENITSVDPPKFTCLLCGAKFKKSQGRVYERHVVNCSNRKESEIHEMSPRTKLPGVFSPENYDTEEEAFYRTKWAREDRGD